MSPPPAEAVASSRAYARRLPTRPIFKHIPTSQRLSVGTGLRNLGLAPRQTAYGRAKTSDTLVPPKPKLFDSVARSVAVRAWFGT